jgi:hypothetical protein
MEPIVRDQALLLVRRLRREPKPGDLVVYQQPMGKFPVVHRLHRRIPGGWLLGGDANPLSDPTPVPETAIYGRVCLILPRVGKFLKILQSGIGLWNR